MRSLGYGYVVFAIGMIAMTQVYAQTSQKTLPQKYTIDGPGGGVSTPRGMAQPVPSATSTYQSQTGSGTVPLTGQSRSGVPVSTIR